MIFKTKISHVILPLLLEMLGNMCIVCNYLSMTQSVYTVCSFVFPSRELSKYIETKVQVFFEKIKRGLKPVFLGHFLHDL